MTTFVSPTHDEWLELRKRDITSTEISILAGCGYDKEKTPYWLYQAKSGAVEASIEQTDAMLYGVIVEESIAKFAAEQYSWNARPMKCYMRHGNVSCMGSSFDWEVMGSDGIRWAIMEIKNVGRRMAHHWENGPPEYVEWQLQHQLEVANTDMGFIVASIGGEAPIVYERPRNKQIGKACCVLVNRFWDNFDKGIAPHQSEYDAATIIKMAAHGDREGTLIGDESFCDNALSYHTISRQINDLNKKKNKLKANILSAAEKYSFADAGELMLAFKHVKDNVGVKAGDLPPDQVIGARKGHIKINVKEK